MKWLESNQKISLPILDNESFLVGCFYTQQLTMTLDGHPNCLALFSMLTFI